ncbi:uncharacterized protein N7458_002590 [Penicillium daleae]|uniref:DNA/RNA-binding domain-containing protein n=1 Tax=Penicillium daleae TaxID=63821 RepID=A0AAD6CDD0_9EURO|nr:uncharacterized protein N7458_002590 [Penicillium daleae]KAJ5461038.1 hypothetical protein N7458_002590 [Penicillium daleae]
MSVSQHEQDYALESSPAPSEVVMLTEPPFIPISEDQLVNEVQRIYSDLVNVEKRCVEMVQQWRECKVELSSLLHCHQNLLEMYLDFFLTSQRLSGGTILKSVAEKYQMPTRVWGTGINSPLAALKAKRPQSLDYVWTFIYIAYSSLTSLLENVSVFRETWMDFLGDLAQFGMDFKESEMDCKVWAGIARDWYSQVSDQSPKIGRIQYRLAMIAWPDFLKQLFLLMKALITVFPFPDARDGIEWLFTHFEKKGIVYAIPPGEFITLRNRFLALLQRDTRLLLTEQQVVHIVSCNIASVLQYGEPDAVIALSWFKRHGETNFKEAHNVALELMSGQKRCSIEAGTAINPQIAYQESSLAFHTLSVLLDQVDNPTVFPSIHISLSFVWCLALHPPAMQQLERYIPWMRITHYLNSLVKPDTVISIFGRSSFPLTDGSIKYLPEDFLIRGQSWSQLYHPDDFFNDAPPEHDRRIIENQYTATLRLYRCLWLGGRIATVIKLLLDRGADVNAWGGEYGSALQVASSQGHQEAVRRN